MSTTRQQLRPMKPIPGGTFWMGSAGDTVACHLRFRCVVRGSSPDGQ